MKKANIAMILIGLIIILFVAVKLSVKTKVNKEEVKSAVVVNK